MRQVFSSVRLENVEGVAKLLGEHGIEVRITNGRSYKGNRRGGFSYLDKDRNTAAQPTVWVVFPDDQLKARALLREAGLMDTTREGLRPETSRPAPIAPTPGYFASRARMWVLIAVVILGGMTTLRSCQKPEPSRSVPPAPVVTPDPAPRADPQDDPDRHIVPIDTSLLKPDPSTN